jgi:hypothetical protein
MKFHATSKKTIMKKLTFIAAIILLASTAFTSCKKDYHCVCTLNGNSVSNNDLGSMTHHDAVNKCDSYDNAGSVTYQCNVQ